MSRPVRPHRSPGLFSSLLLFAAFAFLTINAYRFISFWAGPGTSGPSRTVFYEVLPGEGPNKIAKNLEKVGVVSNAKYFYWYARLTGRTVNFKTGDYRFFTKMRPDEVLGIITSGISFGYPLRVPEGLNMKQIAALFDEFRPGAGEKYLRLCRDKKFISTLGFSNPPSSLEGYLYPNTYLVGRKTPEEEVVRQMVHKYRETFTREMMDRAKMMGLSEHQVVTFASVVEKETGAPQERPLIASVFHNRLKKRMKLQSDPTVIYGASDYKGNIRRKHLEEPHPYNTYVIKGLPPGPIANPGKEALLAVLYPAESEYLYFVSHNDGTHEFTTNYADHQKAVEKYQLSPRAREGHSWRELGKKLQEGQQK